MHTSPTPITLLLALALAGAACQHRPVALPAASGPAEVTMAQLHIAEEALKASRRATESSQAASQALLAAEIAWDLSWKESEKVLRYPGPRVAKVYEQAVLRLLDLAEASVTLQQAVGREFQAKGPRGTYLLTVDPRTLDALRDYPRLEPASVHGGKGGFRNRHVREGMGLPMVGINQEASLLALIQFGREDPFRRPKGYTAPRTAVLAFDKPPPPGQARRVSLAVVDPRKVTEERIGSRVLPVAADLTAPLMAAYPEFGNMFAALGAAIDPTQWFQESGIYALERYDEDRIPVLLVHGLFSTPDMWKDVINDLNATPGIGNRYQFYVFTYPTGMAPAYTAAMLRERLTMIRARRPLPKGYVLIGHSMGGILSRAQATEPGRVLWNQALGDKADRAWARSTPDDPLRESLAFHADPGVRRIIFACVPHRGSPMADLSPVRFLARLAKMPLDLTQRLATSPLKAVGLLPEQMPTSADGLSPESPFLKGLDKLPVRAPFHSIIGNRGKEGPLEQSSDGIVPYWSSHQKAALSEVVVPAGHGGFAHPMAIEEMKRILLEDARTGRR